MKHTSLEDSSRMTNFQEKTRAAKEVDGLSEALEAIGPERVLHYDLTAFAVDTEHRVGISLARAGGSEYEARVFRDGKSRRCTIANGFMNPSYDTIDITEIDDEKVRFEISASSNPASTRRFIREYKHLR